MFVNGRKTNQAQAGPRGSHPDRQRRDRVLAVRPAGRRRDVPARQWRELASYKKLYEFSSKLMASYELPDAAGPAAGRHDPGVERRQGVPRPDGVGRAGRQGRPQPAARDHLRRRPPAVGLDHRARRQDAASRSSSRDALNDEAVQELAVGREPEADLGDVRAAARARQHAGRHLRRQRQRRRSCSTSRTSRC